MSTTRALEDIIWILNPAHLNLNPESQAVWNLNPRKWHSCNSTMTSNWPLTRISGHKTHVLSPLFQGPTILKRNQKLCNTHIIFIVQLYHYSGLSKSHIHRPGLSNLTPGPACFPLNKSCRLAWSYLSNQWSQNKVWPINGAARPKSGGHEFDHLAL